MRAGGAVFQPKKKKKNNRVNRKARYSTPGSVHSGALVFRFWPRGKVRGIVIIYLLSLEKYLCFALDLCFSHGGEMGGKWVENGWQWAKMGRVYTRYSVANGKQCRSCERGNGGLSGVKLRTVKTGLLRSGYANVGRAKS